MTLRFQRLVTGVLLNNICLSHTTIKKSHLPFEWQFQKNVLLCQKSIFIEIFGKKGSLEAVKAFSLAKSISTGKSKSFFVRKKKSWKNLN